MEAAPALVAMTMYFVAGGDGCDGVPGRGDIRVRELGTLMMLGVRGPVDPLNPLCETVRVGRGYETERRLVISPPYCIFKKNPKQTAFSSR